MMYSLRTVKIKDVDEQYGRREYKISFQLHDDEASRMLSSYTSSIIFDLDWYEIQPSYGRLLTFRHPDSQSHYDFANRMWYFAYCTDEHPYVKCLKKLADDSEFWAIILTIYNQFDCCGPASASDELKTDLLSPNSTLRLLSELYEKSK